MTCGAFLVSWATRQFPQRNAACASAQRARGAAGANVELPLELPHPTKSEYRCGESWRDQSVVSLTQPHRTAQRARQAQTLQARRGDRAGRRDKHYPWLPTRLHGAAEHAQCLSRLPSRREVCVWRAGVFEACVGRRGNGTPALAAALRTGAPAAPLPAAPRSVTGTRNQW